MPSPSMVNDVDTAVPGVTVVRSNGVVKPWPPVVVKPNGPPAVPVVVFVTMIVGRRLFTMVHTAWSPGAIVTSPPAVAAPPFSEHEVVEAYALKLVPVWA